MKKAITVGYDRKEHRIWIDAAGFSPEDEEDLKRKFDDIYFLAKAYIQENHAAFSLVEGEAPKE